MPDRRARWLMALCSVALPAIAHAADAPPVPLTADPGEPSILVVGRQQDLTGIATSANQGTVGAADLALRPIFRPGEVVEQIPGVIITQHSGSGKANQYFLRGFNLDHGTDLAVSVDDVPVNMPSHAHGQGYADLNFLIPELVERIDYKKGPYYADVGDFGSAGAIDLHYYDVLPEGIARIEGGQTGYIRGVLADSRPLGAGNILGAIELEHNDGPWVQGDNERKIDGVLRYSVGDRKNGWSISAEGYHNVWRSTDQVPLRAVRGEDDPYAPPPPGYDRISRYGEIDPSDGGNTGRYALLADWRRTGDDSSTKLNAFAEHYNLNLFSNFTYFLNDPVHGDQIYQHDNRWIVGGKAAQSWRHTLFGRPSETTIGLDVRHDDIDNGLYLSEDRRVLSSTAVAHVDETSLSPYIQNQTRWTDWLRTILGARLDAFFMNVDGKRGTTASGNVDSHRVSPKAAVIFGPWAKTELYLNYGQGFHSNDARGVVQPVDGSQPLPRSSGEEVGLRTTIVPGLRSELSLWRLHLASELVWAGDAGTNEPSGPTTRYGVEFANWYTPTRWLTIDADYAWSHSRFTDDEPDGPYVPEALVQTFDGGIAVHDLPGRVLSRVTAGLRLRYFGPRPLTQDNSVRSKATTLVYADIGYRIFKNVTLAVNVFNLLDAHDSDIDYFYTSRLPGEPLGGVDDVHTHPSEPREVRASLTASF